jgi:antitoxin PrlF
VASITIRNLDDDIKQRLRVRAAEHGRSMEEEARDILRRVVGDGDSPRDLAAAIRARVAPAARLDLDLPAREPMREPPPLGRRPMASTLEVESTLTDRYQTTVPETVRRALRLRKRDKIQYTIRPGGEVVLTRARDAQADDPVLGQFLGFLAHDIAAHPERLQAVDEQFVQRIQSLVGSVEVDMETPLSEDDE